VLINGRPVPRDAIDFTGHTKFEALMNRPYNVRFLDLGRCTLRVKAKKVYRWRIGTVLRGKAGKP
jgi:hypothetical protein